MMALVRRHRFQKVLVLAGVSCCMCVLIVCPCEVSAQPCDEPVGGYLSGDITRDCYVNMRDFVALKTYWGGCTDSDDPDCFRATLDEPQLVHPVALPGTSGLAIYAICPTEKVFADTDLSLEPDLVSNGDIKMSLARNESEQFVLVLRPTTSLSDITIAFDPLQGPATIPADNCSWRRIIDVYVAGISIYYGLGGWETGMVPDPLSGDEAFTAAADENARLLVDVAIPEQTPAGKYSGAIKIMAGVSVLATVPLSIEVWDITLAAPSGFKVAASNTGIPELTDLGVTHHKYGAEGLTWYYDWVFELLTLYTTDYANSMHDFIDVAGAAAVALPPSLLGYGDVLLHSYLNTGVPVGSASFWPIYEEFMTKMGDFYRANGWEDNVYWWMMDEIAVDHHPLCEQLAILGKQHFPELDIWLVTEAMNDGLAAALDGWVVPWHFFLTTVDDIPEWDHYRNDLGLTLYAYMNSLYFINADWNFRANRYFAPVLAKYSYEGALWYALQDYVADPCDPRDVLEQVWDKALIGIGNPPGNHMYGGGYLIYPPRSGETDYHSSLRWENFQQGIDEYDLLQVLKERVATVSAQLPLSSCSPACQDMLSLDNIVRHWGAMLASEFRFLPDNYRSDGAYVHRFRQLLAHEITGMLEAPLVLLDCPMSSWTTDQASITLQGVCQAGTQISVGDQIVGGLGNQQLLEFSIEHPLNVGTNLISVLVADDKGNVKILYREIIYTP